MNAMVQAWWPRFLRNGPGLTGLLLAGLMLLECVRIALPLMSRHPSSGRQIESVGPSAPHPRSSGLDVRSIVAAHIFGSAENAQEPSAAVPTTASLVLEGTLATGNPKGGVAIVTVDGQARVYQVGDAVEGASLDAVYLDHILLDRDGRFETLSIARSPLSIGNARSLPATDGGAEETSNGRSLSDLLRAEPSLDDQSDSLRGFRIRPGRTPSAFMRSGLRPGDLVTAVNGTPLAAQDRQRSQAIVDTMLASNHATVSVLRNGIPMEISVESPQ